MPHIQMLRKGRIGCGQCEGSTHQEWSQSWRKVEKRSSLSCIW